MSRVVKSGSMPGADKRMTANTANAVRIIGGWSNGIDPALSRMSTESRSKKECPREEAATPVRPRALLAHPPAIVSTRIGAIHDRYGIFCFRGSTSAPACDAVGTARRMAAYVASVASAIGQIGEKRGT